MTDDYDREIRDLDGRVDSLESDAGALHRSPSYRMQDELTKAMRAADAF
ncbi:hypothetical protein ABZV67_42190 [Streptomyces sp. NPDC005065]